MAGDLLLQDPATVTEIKFAFFYCMFSFWSSGLLVLVCTLSEGVEAFGSVLHSANFLGLAALYELGKVVSYNVSCSIAVSYITNSVRFGLQNSCRATALA